LARVYGERKRNFVGQHFWARGFFVSTVGREEAVIREYNAFEYLQALQTHVEDVLAHPAQWLPWNYREQLTPRLARAA